MSIWPKCPMCKGDIKRHEAGCQYQHNPPSQPVSPILPDSTAVVVEEKVPALPTGWRCPVCSRGNAPWADHCKNPLCGVDMQPC